MPRSGKRDRPGPLAHAHATGMCGGTFESLPSTQKAGYPNRYPAFCKRPPKSTLFDVRTPKSTPDVRTANRKMSLPYYPIEQSFPLRTSPIFSYTGAENGSSFSVVCRNTQSNDLFHAVIAMPLGAVLGNSTNGKALFHEKNRLPIGSPDQHDVGALFL